LCHFHCEGGEGEAATATDRRGSGQRHRCRTQGIDLSDTVSCVQLTGRAVQLAESALHSTAEKAP